MAARSASRSSRTSAALIGLWFFSFLYNITAPDTSTRPAAVSGQSMFAVSGPGCIPTGGQATCNDRAFFTAYDQDLNPIRTTNFGGPSSGRSFTPSLGVQRANGPLHLIGQTSDNTLPVVSPVQATNNGSAEGFVMTVDPATGAHSFLSYLGGSSFDFLQDMAVDAAGNRWIVGETHSSDFPTTRSGVQPSLKGRLDGFVVKITP